MSDEGMTYEFYSGRFLLHMTDPQNLGELETPDGQAELVGECGDSVGMQIAVKDNVIETVRIQPNGCAHTLVCSSVVGQMATGRTLEQALEINPEDVIEYLGSLPEDHYHCARLAVNTLGESVADYHYRQRLQQAK